MNRHSAGKWARHGGHSLPVYEPPFGGKVGAPGGHSLPVYEPPFGGKVGAPGGHALPVYEPPFGGKMGAPRRALPTGLWTAIRRESGRATAVTPYRFMDRHSAGKWARHGGHALPVYGPPFGGEVGAPGGHAYRAWRFNFYLIGDPSSLLRTLPPLVGSAGGADDQRLN